METPEAIGPALFGKTRRALLALLFGHPDESFYLREIARIAGVGLGAVQRELQGLDAAGIVSRSPHGRHIFFQANPDCPIYEELVALTTKTFALADVLREALAPLADRIRVAFVYGSMARGTHRAPSDVDLMIVGEVSWLDVIHVVSPTQDILRREVNPTIYPVEEFRAKLVANHPFLSAVLQGPKLFVIGDDRDLAGVAGEPVVGAPPGRTRGGANPPRPRGSRSHRGSGAGIGDGLASEHRAQRRSAIRRRSAGSR
jgi:predicted nucleotidyltransferase